jgi:pimeloyl-ACP methyl ester carboxylesterase
MAELLPGAELDPPLEGAGHFLQEDRGEAVAERIAAWLGLDLRPNSYESGPPLHT